MVKKLLRIKLFYAILGIVILSTFANILAGYLYLPGPLQEKKIVLIEKGLSTGQISQRLYDAGVIGNSKFFEIICKIYSIKTPLKSGEYAFTSRISPLQILRKLATGKSIIHKLKIPEGSMVSEIIEIINSQELLDGTISNNIPEGYLMPSTYFYSYGDKRENIIDKMRKAMSNALDEVMPKLSPNSPLKSRKDVLILASIVEKEAGNDLERPLIAAVFINRLKKNMKLQADPTSAYAVTDGKYKLKRPLTKSDLKIASPYNTYYIFGLPIGAISCPGKKSLEAVVNPAKTDDLYFVANGSGGHNFSKTLKDHNHHVQNFRNR